MRTSRKPSRKEPFPSFGSVAEAEAYSDHKGDAYYAICYHLEGKLNVSRQREQHNPLPLLLALPPSPVSEGLVTQLERSVWGCHYLLRCLNDPREAVERDGELTEAMVNDFKKWMRQQGWDMGRKLDQFHAWRVANPEQLQPESLRARHRDEVLKYLDRKIRDGEFLKGLRAEREEAEEQARQAAAVLPSEATLDKILRYETAL